MIVFNIFQLLAQSYDFQVFLSSMNDSVHYQLFVCIQLNVYTYDL